MNSIYLFDWGNTLMVDFPQYTGKMCDWETVQAVDGAPETLAYLSAHHKVYIATGAADSSEAEIQQAFDRVHLSQYISGYFCKANLGIEKGSALFYQAIVEKLAVDASDITMIGDSLEKDIIPALEAGLNAIWFNAAHLPLPEKNLVIREYQHINGLWDLIR